jgi:hypothetical protein
MSRLEFLQRFANKELPPPVESGHPAGKMPALPMGSRTATAEGRVVDRGGKLDAHPTTTCIVLRQ